MHLASALILLVCAGLVLRTLARLRGTTLTTAAGWALAGLLLVAAGAGLPLLMPPDQSGRADLLMYAAAVVLLCPGIAVLGARRPGAAVWSCFVLIPLCLVLMWPAAASTRVLRLGTPLELETPALLGFGLVLIMSAGNYLGTRHSLATVLYAAALALLIAPLSAPLRGSFPDRKIAWLAGTVALTGALLRVRRRARGTAGFSGAGGTMAADGVLGSTAPQPASGGGQDGWDRIWQDFVDGWGTVWSRRVMDRLNEFARHEHWCVRLDWHGFEWQTDASAQDRLKTLERLDHSLRWLLKRFVDSDWINRRLTAPPARTGEEAREPARNSQ